MARLSNYRLVTRRGRACIMRPNRTYLERARFAEDYPEPPAPEPQSLHDALVERETPYSPESLEKARKRVEELVERMDGPGLVGMVISGPR